MPAASTYDKLVAELRRLDSLGEAVSLLQWDEQVNLPPQSGELRAESMAVLADIAHREASRPQIGEWLTDLEAAHDELDEAQQALVRETRVDYDRRTKIPPEFVARQAAHRSRSFHLWKKARSDDDFAAFAPALEESLALAKEEAGYFGRTGAEAYAWHVDTVDRGMSPARIDELFTALRTELVPLVRELDAAPGKPDPKRLHGLAISGQEQITREVIAGIGFDNEHGRLDIAVHPFCSGGPLDTRLTTRYSLETPLESFFSGLHEAGHGLYQQGLRTDLRGTPLAQPVGMAVHESQSRLWENQVGRSRAFWQHWEPRFREIFGTQVADIDSEELYRLVNAVEKGCIRVDADEVHYNLHIILRFTLEQALFRGDLAVAELPAAWNETFGELFGFRPSNDREGVLQDVHWAEGIFGYFPSYCLGNMIAAQLWEAVNRELTDLDEQLAKGETAALLAWLRREVHQHGRRYDTETLTEKVTGERLAPRALLTYLRDRYATLYT